MPPVDLANFDGEYQETPAATDQVPDGIYQCKIDTAEMKETKSGEYWMLALKMKVLVGQYHGSSIFLNVVITGKPDNLRFVKRDLMKLGFKGALSQLDAACETFLDQCVEVKVQTKKDRDGNDRTNVYLNKSIDAPKTAMPEGNFAPPSLGRQASELPPEDDIPF